MFIEPLESRRLLSASLFATTAAPPSASTATTAPFHTRALAKLTRNITGSYTGFYSLGNTTFAGSGAMTIATQTTKNFTGTLAFDDGPSIPFNAKLTNFKPNGSQGAGYYFTFPLKSGATKLQLKGAFQNGANGFHVQFTGKLNAAKVPKPHGEFVFTPTDPSTFLR
jgi:ABC-type branched-subunit amino acid transport system permease subunit